VLSLRRTAGPRWGLPRLVGMLERAAKRVNRLYEGSVLVVGDLSEKHGGEISGHKSHESGRDADVGFFFVQDDGELEKKGDFLVVDSKGKARQKPRLLFDDARNWALVESFLTDREARVEHIFVSNEIRARLLAHARRKGTYLPVLHRAALSLKQPRRGLAHDDHFHVRIACPPKQRDLCLASDPVATSKKAQSLVKPRKKREATRK
jgi:penicillin-insensitive murein endopeptidase